MSDLPFILLLIAASVVTGVVWMVPIFVASSKHHPQLVAIKVCTFCAILFPPAWIAALVWAFISQPQTKLPPRLLRPSERRDTATAMEQTRQAKELMEWMP